MTRRSPVGSQPAPCRTPVRLGANLESRVRLYAAGAGSLGLLAWAQPAKAQIIFTPVNVTLRNGTLPIDLDHDGVTDLNIDDKTLTGSCCFYTQVLRVNGNGNLGAGVVGGRGSAGALQAGRVIGAGDPFQNVQNASANMATAFNDSNSFFFISGQFANTTSRFLGLRFQINGETHYGWAQFTFVQAGFSGSIPYVTAHLLGYAYDTVPNQPLRAGQKVSDDVESSLSPQSRPNDTEGRKALQPATLGLLTLGSPGLSAWRRKEGPETDR